MAYEWEHFTAYLDGTRPITTAERDELWDALADLLARCGGRWQLASDDMEAIKASRLATDKTVVEDPEDAGDFREGDLAVVLIDIEDTFTGTTGLDAFKEVAGAEGLSEAQLAEIITGSGRVTLVDTFHLWNLYKRVLDYLQCCPTTLPAFEYDSVGRSLSKTGSNVSALLPACAGGPAKYYRHLAWSGQGKRGTSLWERYSGSGDLPAPSGTFVVETTSMPPSDCSPTGWTPVSAGGADYCNECPEADGALVVRLISCADTLFGCPNTAKATFTNPYLTPELIANVQAEIEAEGFDGDFDDTAGSYVNLSEDEASYSERQSKARLPLAGLPLTDGRTYNAIYVIRFTPNVGTPVDGAEQTLSVSFSEGMTHSTPIDLPLPTANGVNTAVLVRWECPEGEGA